jgi:excinuclease ABC subunit B
VPLDEDPVFESVPPERMQEYLLEIEERMREAARKFDFKQAATYRDRLQEIKTKLLTDAAS